MLTSQRDPSRGTCRQRACKEKGVMLDEDLNREEKVLKKVELRFER